MTPMASPSKLRVLCLGLASLLALSGCATAGPATPATTGGATTPASTSTIPGTAGTSATSAATPTASGSTATTQPTQGAGLAVHRNADGSCTMPAQYAGKDFESTPTGSKKVIALTFDGGASNAADKKILQVLEEKQAVATFFFTGKFAEMYPDTVKTIAAKYPIGNHSYDHPEFTKLTDAKVNEQLTKGEAAIVKASGGVTPVPFFRFPYGNRNAHAIQLVNKQCYVPFRWTIDTLGWDGTGKGNTAAKITDLVLSKATPGGIVLMHQGDHPTDHSTLDADALPAMIDGLRAKGYELVTLADALQG